MKSFNLIFFFFIAWFLLTSNLFAKEVKPKVMVYGDNLEAFAAALQSARSNVPTLWVVPSSDFCSDYISNSDTISVSNTLVGGIWMNILQDINGNNLKSDSVFNSLQQNLQYQLIHNAMAKMVQNQMNLTVVKGVKVTKLINNKKNIDVILSNKQKLKVLAVVDASEQLDLIRSSNIQIQLNKTGNHGQPTSGPIQGLEKDLLRTLIAVNSENRDVFGFTVKSILEGSFDNIFILSSSGNPLTGMDNIPAKLNLGQAVGASAAYCAFFKTTSDKIDVRRVQAELLSFESRLLPFADVSIEDPNFNALQRIFLVNILPWDNTEVPLLFNGTDSVSIDSVKPVLQQLFSRAQLWFVDNKMEYFKTSDLIELIKVIAFRGNELNGEIEKAWTKRFHFGSDFNPDHIISRYEFAVLIDAYANPFSKTINLEGQIKR